MKCCSQLSQPTTMTESAYTPINSLTSSNSTTIKKINSGFQFDSGFCQYCGVDVFLFAHEFWCRLSNST